MRGKLPYFLLRASPQPNCMTNEITQIDNKKLHLPTTVRFFLLYERGAQFSPYVAACGVYRVCHLQWRVQNWTQTAT